MMTGVNIFTCHIAEARRGTSASARMPAGAGGPIGTPGPQDLRAALDRCARARLRDMAVNHVDAGHHLEFAGDMGPGSNTSRRTWRGMNVALNEYGHFVQHSRASILMPGEVKG